MNKTFLNYVHTKMIHIRESVTGKKFANICIPCPQSKTGYGSFSVSCGQIFPSTNYSGTPVNGYYNILLGKPDIERQVSIATNKKGTNWKTISMTCAQIKQTFDNAREEYRNSQKAA